jgi:hypothetical protein
MRVLLSPRCTQGYKNDDHSQTGDLNPKPQHMEPPEETPNAP